MTLGLFCLTLMFCYQIAPAQKLQILQSFGKFNSNVGQISSATNLALNGKNTNIFIADTGNNRILKLGWDGTVSNVFGSRGSDPGQLMSPKDVAVDSEGNIIIADTMNNRIQKLAADGTFLWEHFIRCPYGVVIDSNDRIVAAQAEAPVEIEVLSPEGERIPSCFGCDGAESKLDSPHDLAIDRKGFVYITDLAANRIQKYTSDGYFVESIGQRGNGKGSFNHPWGIAIDGQDRLWVTDMDNHRVQVLTTEGDFLYSFDLKNTLLPASYRSTQALPYPKGITITEDNQIFITLAGLNTVAKYTLLQ